MFTGTDVDVLELVEDGTFEIVRVTIEPFETGVRAAGLCVHTSPFGWLHDAGTVTTCSPSPDNKSVASCLVKPTTDGTRTLVMLGPMPTSSVTLSPL